jgi:peroxiredoxin (alkyl hydroperoxide reductase subunit C)
MTATINQPAPGFTAKAYHNNQFVEVSLAQQKGKWVVLFFYPADFTFVCPTELEELAEKYDELKKMKVEVLAVSRDTEFVHKAWHDHSVAIKKIAFPMVADTTGSIARDYGVLIEGEGLALRGTFVIDPEGVLKAYEVHDNSIGRSSEELMRKILAAQFVRENGGEVCPASWKPGKKTLKPSVDLVGKL